MGPDEETAHGQVTAVGIVTFSKSVVPLAQVPWRAPFALEPLLYARHSAKNVTRVNLSDPHRRPMKRRHHSHPRFTDEGTEAEGGPVVVLP